MPALRLLDAASVHYASSSQARKEHGRTAIDLDISFQSEQILSPSMVFDAYHPLRFQHEMWFSY